MHKELRGQLMEGTSLLRYKGSGCHIQIIRLGGKCLTVSNFFSLCMVSRIDWRLLMG